jgi:hypothetical protein
MSHSFIATVTRGFFLFFALSLLGALLPTNPVSNLPGWGSRPAAAAAVYCISDVDANGASDALTDGLLIIRRLFGFSGATLTDGALASDATRIDPAAIAAYIEANEAAFDVDANGVTDALTDGLLIVRRLFGFTGTTLTDGALAPDATRTDPAAIAASIDALGTCSFGPNQAILGPLSGAQINAYRLSDLDNPIEGPFDAEASTSDLGLAGTFFLALTGIPDDEWILVTATGGTDIDADDDGVVDGSPTQNLGTLHALARAGDWRGGGVHITALSDIVWDYTRNLVGKVPPENLAIRLDDLVWQFIEQDLDGDSLIDRKDFLHFVPSNAVHRAALNFDYQRLFTPDAEGDSIIGALHNGDEALIGELLDTEFSHTLTRLPVPDSRYQSVRVGLVLAGEGRAEALDGSLLVDSALPEEQQMPSAYFPICMSKGRVS